MNEENKEISDLFSVEKGEVIQIPEEVEGIREISRFRYYAEGVYSVLSRTMQSPHFYNGLARGGVGIFALTGTAKRMYVLFKKYSEADEQRYSDIKLYAASENPHPSIGERLTRDGEITSQCLEEIMGITVGFGGSSTLLFSVFGFALAVSSVRGTLLATNIIDGIYQIYNTVRGDAE